MQPNLEQTTNTLLHWVKSSMEDIHLKLAETAIENCLVKVHSKSYPINDIVKAENLIIGAILLRQIELDEIGKDADKKRMLEQNYVDSVHRMD
jgi:hypothetical protein